jgi:hypothetical protein
MNARLERTPALDQIDDQHYDGEDEQKMNEAPQRVGAHQAK